MPQHVLSPTEYALVVRVLMDVQHRLTVLDDGIWIEPGTAIEDATEVTSTRLDNRDFIQALELARRALGFDFRREPQPPQLRELLAALNAGLLPKGKDDS